jgi:hypothetical protein
VTSVTAGTPHRLGTDGVSESREICTGGESETCEQISLGQGLWEDGSGRWTWRGLRLGCSVPLPEAKRFQ